MTEATPLSQNLGRVQRMAFRVGIAAFVVLLLGLFTEQGSYRFFQAYLVGFLFWLAPTLGSLVLSMLHNVTGGAWGFAIRRLLEAGMRTLPWVALMFVPLLFGIHNLYHWSHADVVAQDEVLQSKQAYLNVPFFIGRAAVYFVVWLGLVTWLGRLIDRHDRTLNVAYLRKLRGLSAVGILVYVVTMSFASFDWGMSLEPHWFSTIYGVHFIVGQALSTFCLAIVVAWRLSKHEPFSRWITKDHFNDLGNLMLAFVMLWAYMSFSQFLIIWSGNLPEETPWYLRRTGDIWQVIALLLIACHFAMPFAVLLSRRNKRRAEILAKLALGLFLVRFLDFFWVLVPAFEHEGGAPLSFVGVVMYLAAPVALGGLWIGLFVRNLRDRPLVSLQDGKLLGKLEEAPA